jgi:hypothetical protein
MDYYELSADGNYHLRLNFSYNSMYCEMLASKYNDDGVAYYLIKSLNGFCKKIIAVTEDIGLVWKDYITGETSLLIQTIGKKIEEVELILL